MIGKTLSHFRILNKLGRGGMGEVFLARDLHLKRNVAIKILRQDRSEDPDGRRRFIQEAKTASAINHANVAHIYEIGESDGLCFIVMEYVEGRTLGVKIHEEILATAEIKDLA